MDFCIPNIGPRQRRRRLLLGLASFAAAAVLAVMILIWRQPSVLLRASLVLPLYGGFLGFMQYRERT